MTDEIGMDEILAQNPDSNPGEIIEGTVVGLTDTHVIINVGLKLEAAVPFKEFGKQVPVVGAQFPLLLIRISGPEGRPLVSWRQAREKKHWDRIAEAHKSQQPVDAKIVEKIKGGFAVDIGLDAFMPASQVDLKPVTNPAEWIGKTVQVLVLEMDRSKGSVLVSRRKIAESEKATKRVATLATIQEGQLFDGKVNGLTNFGAFVDIGGVEGLLHNSDLSWNRSETAQKILKVGQDVQVKVLKYDTATQRISLGRKQLLSHPWEGLEKKYPIGAVVKGKVKSLAEFGAFVELEPGIEGLVHVSELSWTERVKKPQGHIKAGQDVQVKMLNIDRENEKISLSLRRAGPSPWENILKQYPLGSKVEGEITHIAPFGAFVKLPLGIEALLKTQDISWTDRVSSAQSVFQVGQKLTVMVLEINPQDEKIAVGLKQMTPDPIKMLKPGQQVNGVVSKVGDFGLIIKLESGLEGLVRSSELQHGRSMFSEPQERKDRNQRFAPVENPYKVGDPITASVLKSDRKERKLELSIRKYEQNQERELLKKYTQTGRLTLGETTGWNSESDKK